MQVCYFYKLCHDCISMNMTHFTLFDLYHPQSQPQPVLCDILFEYIPVFHCSKYTCILQIYLCFTAGIHQCFIVTVFH